MHDKPNEGREPEHSSASNGEDSPLHRGCARDKILFFDAFSGVSGDMTVSALLDLGVPLDVLRDSLSLLPLGGYRLEQGQRWSSGICASSFDVHVDQPQPERTWRTIDTMLADSTLPEAVKSRARSIFEQLARAEAKVHRTSIDSVHFHEVGAVDAIVDIVGIASLVAWLEPSEVVCSPLPFGYGTVKARHGTLPLPAPAALECLRGVPTYGVPIEAELVTPTGAAVVSTLCSRFERWPSIVPERIAFGSGSSDLGDRPNLLRVLLGREEHASLARTDGDHTVMEANVDDMTGELAGHVLDSLISSGALDVWVTPTTTKKGRPGLVLAALVENSRAQGVEETMLRDTTSIGVRYHAVSRVVRPRSIVEVETPYGSVPVKVSRGGVGPDQVKPEFDACAKLAAAAGVPVREVIAAALCASRQIDPTKLGP